MNVSGTVCQCIHYIHSKQWLAIDLKWPALKVNNAHGLISADNLYFYFDDLHLQIIESTSRKASVENSSAQLAIFFQNLYYEMYTDLICKNAPKLR